MQQPKSFTPEAVLRGYFHAPGGHVGAVFRRPPRRLRLLRVAFEPHAPHTASRLVITIEAMQALPLAEFETVFAWLRGLNYPWSSPEAALHGMPANELLAPIAQFLRRRAPDVKRQASNERPAS